MTLDVKIKHREGGANIYLCGPGNDPLWMTLRLDRTTQRLSGYFGGHSGEGLPLVRPVSLFASEFEDLTRDTAITAFATWSFLQASGFDAVAAGEGYSHDTSGIISAWEDFLGGDDAGGRSDTKMRDDVLEIDEAIMPEMVSHGLLIAGTGVRQPQRLPDWNVGNAISGFQALAIREASAKQMSRIPSGYAGDLDAAKSALFAVDRPSSHAVNWYATATGENAKDRAQAAAAFPVLAGLIADNPILARAVDERLSLQGMLMSQTGLGKAALKRLGKITQGFPAGRLFEAREEVRGEDALGVNRARGLSISGSVSLHGVLGHLGKLPADRVPQTNDAWLKFYDILAGCAVPLEYSLGFPVENTLAACKGDWPAFHAALAKAADFEAQDFDRRAIGLSTIDAIEAVGDMARTVVLPTALNSIVETGEPIPDISPEYFEVAKQAAAKVLLGKTKNIGASMFEMARRYASRIPNLIELCASDVEEVALPEGNFAHYGKDRYPRFCRPFTASNGVTIHSRDSNSLLARESEQLKHCVGRSYLNKARRLDCFILSTSDASGAISTSTIELSGLRGATLEEALRNIQCVQHRAKNNGQPSGKDARAAEEFLAHVKAGKVRIDFRELTQFKEVQAGLQDVKELKVSWNSTLGIDWEDQEKAQAVYEEWQYVYGGALAKSPSPKVIYREKAARDLVGAMSPKAASIMIEQARQPKSEPTQDMPSIG